MVKVQLNYNPYTVKTEVYLNGKLIEDKVSPLTYVTNKRLQAHLAILKIWHMQRINSGVALMK